jgi:hypothetical protein
MGICEMKVFLLLTLFGVDSPDLYFAVDTNMTAEDCAIRIEEQQTLLEKTFDINDFALACEIDEASMN